MNSSEPEPRGFLLDTTALIDFLRGRKEVAALLEVLQEKAPLAACPVTVAEVFAGTREKDAPRVNEFLSTLVYYPISYSAARLAGSLRYDYARKGITLSLADTLIAAVALENGLAVVTANTDHFPMKDLAVIPH